MSAQLMRRGLTVWPVRALQAVTNTVEQDHKRPVQCSRRLSLYQTSSQSNSDYPRGKLWGAAVGGIVCMLGYSLHHHASCHEDGCQATVELPPLTLYQYATCPYCCKTRAFLDYYKVPYTIVEVNPLFRREIKFTEYRKVPFVIGGGIQVNDSSVVVSVLHTVMLNKDLSLSEALDLYPEVTITSSKGKSSTERANKYFVMLPNGDTPNDSRSLAERREEREWREWVDEVLIHTLPPNIYRTLSEAVTSFDYISSVGNFNSMERVAAKYVGAVSMFLISKALKKRYKLKDDVRESLYDCCNEWTHALGRRKFMGGEKPNLADLAVYGVLNSMEGMGQTFTDVMDHTKIGPWYRAVQKTITVSI